MFYGVFPRHLFLAVYASLRNSLNPHWNHGAYVCDNVTLAILIDWKYCFSHVHNIFEWSLHDNYLGNIPKRCVMGLVPSSNRVHTLYISTIISFPYACSQGNLRLNPEQIATKTIPVAMCRKFCVDQENIKLPQNPALDHTHFWASLKEGCEQKIIEIHGMWIKKMSIFLLFAIQCW